MKCSHALAFAIMATGCATTATKPAPDIEPSPDLTVALMVRLEAKPEHAETVAQLLRDGQAFVRDEPGTPYWFAVRLGDHSFGIFDAFASDAERTAHLQGKLAAALVANAPDLLAVAPAIQPVEVIGSKDAFVGPCRQLGVGLMVRIDAKPEHAAEVERLLDAGPALVADEPGTPVWFGVKIDDDSYAIFDAFKTTTERQAHLEGKLAQTLVAKAPELLSAPPVIEPADILATKLP